MVGRSPARYLAPLALVAFCVALFLVVTSSQTATNDATAPNEATESRPAASGEDEGEDGASGRRKGPRFYRVKPGDTPSSIAEERGVPLEDILRLNPNLDPQTLGPGTRIRLRR